MVPPPPMTRPLIPYGSWDLEAAIMARLQELQSELKASWVPIWLRFKASAPSDTYDMMLVEWQ